MAFTEEDYWRNLFNQTEIGMTNNYNLFAEIAERPSTKYPPKLSIKDNTWIATHVHMGAGVIIGTGKSPQEAMNDFDKEFRSKLIPKKSPPIPRRPPKIWDKFTVLCHNSPPVKENISTECITINQDGNQFCALMGPNLQEGYAGFGDTPLHAILDLIARQSDDSVLKEILNQKPDPKHWTYPKEE